MGPCWLGRSRLHHIQLDWKKIASVSAGQDRMGDIKALLEDYNEVFLDELGTSKPLKAQLMVH